MARSRRIILAIRVLSAASILAIAPAWPQTLPEEIHIVIGVTAGSSLDARGRVIAEALGQRIQRRVIVENRPGAGGTLAALAVAKSKPDGATLLFTNNSHVVSPHVYPEAGYDPIRDFAAVGQGYASGMVLVAHPDLQVTSVGSLVARLREAPQPTSYASSGTGSLPHLAMELFREHAGLELLHIPYRGDGQALTDVLAGRVPLLMSGHVVALPHVRAGKLRALAVTSRQRAEIFPDVPTLREAGYPEYSLDVWTGFFAPAATPAAVIDKLNTELAAAIATPAVLAQYAATGAQAVEISPAKFSVFVREEWERYRRMVRKLRLKAE